MNSTSDQKKPDHNWTEEKLAALSLKELRIVKSNAGRKGVPSLVDLCDKLIGFKEPPPSLKRSSHSAETGEIVEEYHFVCRDDRGVTLNPDGTFWSASWVVDEDVVRKSIKYGALLALHNSKQELSYRQGTIQDTKRVDYPEDGKLKSRIDFLVLADASPLKWAGRSSGEKGYKRRKVMEKIAQTEGGTP